MSGHVGSLSGLMSQGIPFGTRLFRYQEPDCLHRVMKEGFQINNVCPRMDVLPISTNNV